MVFNDAGEAVGVVSEGETVKAKMVVGDPSYFTSKVKKAGQVVRSICLMSHPIPNTDNSESCQIIIPQNQVNRKSDIYVSCVSFAHNVAAKGKYIAIVSTTVETANPVQELEAGMMLLGPVDERFDSITDLYEPLDDGTKSKAFISRSYDAQSHFDSMCHDVLSLYKRITGNDLKVDPSRAKQLEEEMQ